MEYLSYALSNIHEISFYVILLSGICLFLKICFENVGLDSISKLNYKHLFIALLISVVSYVLTPSNLMTLRTQHQEKLELIQQNNQLRELITEYKLEQKLKELEI